MLTKIELVFERVEGTNLASSNVSHFSKNKKESMKKRKELGFSKCPLDI